MQGSDINNYSATVASSHQLLETKLRACTNNVAVSHLIAQVCELPCVDGVPRVSGLCACCLARKLLKEGNTVCPGTACIIARDRHKKHYDAWYLEQLALRKSLEAHQLSQDPPPEPEKLNQGYQLPPPLNVAWQVGR